MKYKKALMVKMRLNVSIITIPNIYSSYQHNFHSGIKEELGRYNGLHQHILNIIGIESLNTSRDPTQFFLNLFRLHMTLRIFMIPILPLQTPLKQNERDGSSQSAFIVQTRNIIVDMKIILI